MKEHLTGLVKSGIIKSPEELEEYYYAATRINKKSDCSHFERVDKYIPKVLIQIENFQTRNKMDVNKEFETKFSPIEYDMAKELDKQKIEYQGQYSIGKYVVDFFIEPNIVVECDGNEYHTTKEQIAHDTKRDNIISKKGYLILRFTGSEIKRNVDKCVLRIKQVIK